MSPCYDYCIIHLLYTLKKAYYHLALCWKVAFLRIDKPLVDSSDLAPS